MAELDQINVDGVHYDFRDAKAYQKPQDGIPASDLTSAIQALLTKASTALQPQDLNTLNSDVASLKALIESDSNNVIDKFNEIVAFLNGISSSSSLSGIVSDIATQINAKYTKPASGIPSTDLAQGVQTSLNKANTAYQKPSAGIPKTDLAQEIQDRLNIPIDDEPTAGSNNLVKSGGVQNELALGVVYDVSAKNPTAGPNNDGKWESLSALLPDANLSTLIPTSVRKGGMSIKYVQSSDNKYVQYLYNSTSTNVGDFTNIANWEKTNLEEELNDKTGILNISKNLIVRASQSVYLQEKDWGKNVAIRILSNTATMGDAVIKADLQYSGGRIEKNLSSDYIFFEYSSNFNRIYIYVKGTPSSAGEVQIEIVYGNSYYLVSVDSEPVKDSKHLIESGAVYNGLYDLETKKVISKSVTVKASQQIYLHSANYGKRIALRVISNSSGGTLQCCIYSSGSNVYKTITSDYLVYDSATDITELYIYLGNATSAGEVEVELLYGDSADILALQKDSEDIEKQVTENHNRINYINGEQTPIIKNYVAGESSGYSVSSRINTFIPKGSKIIIKGASISSGLFAEAVSNLTLYIIYSTPNNVDDTAIRYLQNKTNYEIIAPADIYAFVFTAYNSSNVPMSAVIDGSITMDIESVYTPVKNGMSIDLLQGGVSLYKRYLSGTQVSLNQNNRTDIFIPKGSKIKLDYDISSGLFGSSTISIISLYLLTSKDTVTSHVVISYFQNKRGVEVTLEKDIYGLCMAVYGANNVPLTTTINGNITFIIGCVYTNGYCGNAVDALGFDTRLDVPSYYQSGNYLKNKVERIKQISANNVGDNFIFITDTHWDRNAQKSVALLKYLNDNGAYYKRIVNGGDISQVIADTNASGKSINKIASSRIDYIKLLSQLKKKVYYTIGNHEYLTEAYTTQGLFDNVSFNNWHDFLYYPDETDENVVFGNADYHYYYLDNKKSKIRYIFLSSFKQGDEQSVSREYLISATENYDSAQLNWLKNTALNVESGWDIIVFTHRLVHVAASNQHTNDQTFYVTTEAKEYCKALLQYNGNGNILAVIAGHTHRDGMVVINDALLGLSGSDATGKQLFEIITTCDANNFKNLPDEALEDRDSGTIKEQAFDYVSIDKTAKRISLIRIGAPANNAVDYSGTLEERNYVCEQIVLQVGGSVTLDSKLGGTITWASSDTSIVSINDSTIFGVSTGVATITATNDSNHSVMFMVKVL